MIRLNDQLANPRPNQRWRVVNHVPTMQGGFAIRRLLYTTHASKSLLLSLERLPPDERDVIHRRILLGCRIAELAAVHVAPRSTLVMRHCVIHAASRTIKKLITVGKHATLKMHDCRIVLLQRSSRFSHQDLIYAHTSASSRRRAARPRSLRLF